MATKAELESELGLLKEMMAQRDKSLSEARALEHPPRDDTDSTDTDSPGTNSADAGSPDKDPSHDIETLFTDLLKSYGLDTQDFGTIWSQISEELENLPERKPLLTAVGAFGIGFVLGRMSKH